MRRMIWVVFAFLTGCAMVSVMWPLGRRQASTGGTVDRAFYEAELAGIARDLDTGLIGPAEAESARTEAARRLLAAPPEAPATPSRSHVRLVAVLTLVFVPGLTLLLYQGLGQPDYADQPLAARLQKPPAEMDVEVAIARIEKHLAENPDDLRGWELLAPVYMRLGRLQDGARAYGEVVRLRGETTSTLGAWGEALIYAADGEVTAQARGIFEKALARDPAFAQARFYLALGDEQAGRVAEALATYIALVRQSPDAEWAPMVRNRITALGGTPPESGITAPDIAGLPPGEQAAAIRSMVDNLAHRLAAQGGTVDNWAQLIRAYTVLHEPEKARQAVTDGRRALAGDAAAIATLDALASELGLGG